jgi:hypothetical protein
MGTKGLSHCLLRFSVAAWIRAQLEEVVQWTGRDGGV